MTARETLLAESSVNAVDNKLLVGGDATEEKLKALELDQYGVILFAVHAVIDNQFSERNALVLGDLPSSHEDGLLQVREISQFRLRAGLVILSSCVSAVGPAEGLAVYGSLALAFLRAGAHSVVASDWYVDDRMSAKLMGYFYGHLAEGMVASKALQVAKLDIMAKYGGDAPYYWAGFRIIGNGAERIRD